MKGLQKEVLMKIREDRKSINIAELSTKENNFDRGRKEKDRNSGKSIFAGSLRKENDTFTVKKLQAQTKAYKIVSDANKKEVSIDNEVDSRKQYMKALEDSSAQKLKEIKEYKDSIEELKQKFGTSQEVQPYEQVIEKLTQDVKQAQDTIDNERKTLNAIALSRLKQHGMVDAQKASDTILKEASKDMVNMLCKDAMVQVEEQLNEIQEKQDKIEEKEKNEEIKSDKDEKQQDIDTKQECNNHMDLLKQLNKVVIDEKLMEEDIKGIILDEQI